MLNKKEREKVLALYFNAVKNYTVILLKSFAGEKTSNYWDGGEDDRIIEEVYRRASEFIINNYELKIDKATARKINGLIGAYTKKVNVLKRGEVLADKIIKHRR